MANNILSKLKAVNPTYLFFIAIFAFILLYIFTFLDTVNTFCINTPTQVGRFIQKYTPIKSGLNEIPLSGNHPNVISSGVFYNIAGEVDEITPDSLKLRSHDGPLPVFKISSVTPVFKMVEIGKQPELAKMSEVKIDVTLVVSATYDFASNDWRVNRLMIDNNLKPRVTN